MKIHYFSSEPWEEEFVRARIQDAEVMFHEKSLATYPDLSDPDAEVLCTFIESPIGETEMSRFPNLKLIATRSTGFDHIDFKACKKRAILAANVPSYGEDTVAEYAFGLILSLTRRICQGYDRIRETGSFSKEGLRGIDLKGKTLGVIGTGRIGRNVIQIAKGFEMRIIASDTNPDKQFAAHFSGRQKNLPEAHNYCF